MMNIINGGAHAPEQPGHPGIHDHAPWRHVLQRFPAHGRGNLPHPGLHPLKADGHVTSVGDEGGFAPESQES